MRRQPYSVILFDEIEKAHPDVFNILLQMLDDGRLTDSKGRTVDFKNCIIIMTSNIGTGLEEKRNKIGFGEVHTEQDVHADMKERMLEALKKSFRPEFLNRIDDIIVFHKLDEQNTLIIAKLMLIQLLSAWQSVISISAIQRMQWNCWRNRALIRNMVRGRCAEFCSRRWKIAYPKRFWKGKVHFGDAITAYVEEGEIAFRKTE